MGNWRTVQIVGSCGRSDVVALGRALEFNPRTLDGFHCLCCGGICGLPNWAGEQINAVGNLAERDYDAESVKDQLEKLLTVAPSLRVRVHCGNDYEKRDTVATVTIHDDHTVTVGPPEVDEVPEITSEQINANMRYELARPR